MIRVFALLAAAVLAAVIVASCSPSTPATQNWEQHRRVAPRRQAAAPSAALVGPPVHQIQREPLIRVRVAKGVSRFDLPREQGAVLIGSPGQQVGESGHGRTFQAPIHITHTASGFVIHSAAGAMRWALPRLRVAAMSGQLLHFQKQRYPNAVILVPQAGGRFDVINPVALEQYLPGVLHGELYASWHPTTFVALAVAARSYAMWEMSRFPNRHYDIESTQASQVYKGVVANPKAQDAVRRTHGQVLVYDGRVLPAFYSSSIGGVAQDAVYAFPGVVADLPPLRGGMRGEWDQRSSTYRWGPITRDRRALSRRLAAWGKAHRNPVAGLTQLTAIRVAQTNRVGRPTHFLVTDGDGRQFTLACESFRNACNRTVAGLATLHKTQKLKSSHVDVTVRGGAVVFTNGRGYGHGVGLSQWGAQGLATAGYNAPSILAFYYPGTRIERLYSR